MNIHTFVRYALSSTAKLVGALHLVQVSDVHCFVFNLSVFITVLYD